MLKNLHVTLAFISVAGFAVRAAWALVGSPMLQHKLVRVLPHVIDTVLLVSGVALVLSLQYSFAQPWLVAKMVALVAYIGFGVLTLRGTGRLRLAGIAGVAVSLVWLFGAAYGKSPVPF